MTRIDNLNLNLFDFDYDLTFVVFFLDANEKIYARYGGRDAGGPDERQSLAGLHYTMESVLRMHRREDREFAARTESTKYIRDVAGARGRGCYHCHQVREVLDADLRKSDKWSRELFWRYPMPENLGFALEIDRGNVVRQVNDKSPAALAGLKAGDVLRRLNGVPIHSLGDAQFALDRAPSHGAVEVVWNRGNETKKDQLPLSEGWRKLDASWRPSLRHFVPTARLNGLDLKPEEKKALGLPPKQLAFRQKEVVSSQAKNAGIRSGDIIIGVDGRVLDLDSYAFQGYVRRNYFVGDKVTVNILRDGKRQDLPMTLLR